MTKSHRTRVIWSCHLRRAAIGGALGLAALASFAAGAARAQDADSDDNTTTIWNWDKKVMDSFMHSLGLQNGTQNDGIDYKERSPLVVPPTRNLPPPQAKAVAPVPNWPVDPDVKRHADGKNKKKIKQANGDQDWIDFTGNLPENNLDKPRGGAPTTGATTASNGGTGSDMDSAIKPSELGYKGGLFGSLFKSNDDEVGTFTGEKPRTSLVEPPPGYQTPSPSQPYGVTKRSGGTAPKQDVPVGDLGGAL